MPLRLCLLERRRGLIHERRRVLYLYHDLGWEFAKGSSSERYHRITSPGLRLSRIHVAGAGAGTGWVHRRRPRGGARASRPWRCTLVNASSKYAADERACADRETLKLLVRLGTMWRRVKRTRANVGAGGGRGLSGGSMWGVVR
ncbi:hypothetical protein DFH09DRAFT_1081939 [Mycena vulgaris]|nr:hypothetical protein DFH09DRAFT_1081939 [Mycena vulgaris]